MERVGWSYRMTNEEETGGKRTVIETIYHRQRKWLGHVMRNKRLLRDVIEGKLIRKKGRGRKEKRCLITGEGKVSPLIVF